MEKKIKIIDLLNKRANGEELPKRIRIDHWCYKFEWVEHLENYYDKEAGLDLMEVLSMSEEELNYGVEILDEEDEFEDIEWVDVALLGQCDNWLRCPTNEVTKQDIELNPYIINNIRENTLEFQHKINDLIKNQKKIIERLKNE